MVRLRIIGCGNQREWKFGIRGSTKGKGKATVTIKKNRKEQSTPETK